MTEATRRGTDRGELPWPADWAIASRKELCARRDALIAEADQLRAKVHALAEAQEKRIAQSSGPAEEVPELGLKPTLGEYLQAKAADSAAAIAHLRAAVESTKANLVIDELWDRIATIELRVAHIDVVLEDGPGAVGNDEQLRRDELATRWCSIEAWFTRESLKNLTDQLKIERVRKRKIDAALAQARRDGGDATLPVEEG